MALTANIALVAATLSTFVLGGALPAQAAPGDAFEPDAAHVFVAQGDSSATDLAMAVPDQNGDVGFDFAGNPTPFSYNAIGYNTNDNYIYGIATSAGGDVADGDLVRIGQNNELMGHWNVGDVRSFVGAMSGDTLFVHKGDNLHKIDVVNHSSTSLTMEFPTVTGTKFLDWTFLAGYLWGVRTDGQLYRFDTTDGSSTRVLGDGSGSNTIPHDGSDIGAAWTYGNGNLGFSNNTSGQISQVQINDAGSSAPTFTLVSTQSGPGSTWNDGTSSPGPDVDLGVEKSGPAGFAAGDTLTYQVKITNHSAYESSGSVVKDILPAGLTAVGATLPPQCALDALNVTCNLGPIEASGSVTLDIEATADTGLDACVENEAIVLGNENDPNSDNDSATVTVCPRPLTLTKTSDASEQTRVGDTVTYTVTATNNGPGDYTEVDPAVIVDDMTGAADDADYQEDATATVDGTDQGTLDYDAASNQLRWTGPLAAGEKVEITYTAEITSGGDGDVRNVAWQPPGPGDEVPPTPTPPECVDGETGEGQPCAFEDYDLPQLTVQKTSDVTELPADGGTVTYTVTVENVGPGDFTASAPATMSDDLSDVLDDGAFSGSPSVTGPGSASFDGDHTVSWEGALESGESAEIEYTVIYDSSAGDQQLVNSACVPEDLTPADADACATVSIPGGKFLYWKSVEADGDPVVAGSTLTYTLHFESQGNTDADVDVYDLLDGVLDDADFDSGSLSETSGLSASFSEPDRAIHVTGTLEPNVSGTVSYTMTVKSDEDRESADGDDVAVNFVLPPDPEMPEGPPPAPPQDLCEPDADYPTCTETPIAALTVTKSVEPTSGSVVEAGQTLDYTITLESTGQADATVSWFDDLTGVVDDATVTSDPESDTGTVSVSDLTDGIFHIGGTLESGQTATISYSLTVNPDGERGDNVLENFVLPPRPDDPEVPPEAPECEVGSETCTVNPVSGLTVTKSVDPSSGTEVEPGDTLDYTITFESTGSVPVDVHRFDDLSGVLDDATVTSDPESDDGSMSVSDVTDGYFEVIGELGAGETTTVSYSVTVNTASERGDSILANFVLEPDPDDPEVPQDPPSRCADDSDLCTQNPVTELVVTKTSDAADSAQAGDTVEYVVTAKNIGGADYTEADPAVVVDDLTGVLDDAHYSGGATVTTTAGNAGAGSGDLSYSEPQLRWSGPLAAGASVEIAYEVTLASGGDGHVVNVAWQPPGPGDEVPPTPTPPECVDGETESGQPCGTAEFDMPRLAIDKTASTLDLPADGGAVTYTVTVENVGPGDFTASAPASMSDDLSDVLDDGEVSGSPSVTGPGSASFDGDHTLSWEGALTAGQSAVIEYDVTYDSTAGGDRYLVNVACVPETVVAPGESACDHTEIPGGAITHWKTVEADGDPVVAGSTLTYTLHFDSQGTGEAAVDAYDVLDGVVDDATVDEGSLTATDGLAASYSEADSAIRITGSLGAGESGAVTYTVTVSPNGERGDDVAANFLLPPDPENPEGPPPVPAEGCTDADTAFPTCTETPISAVSVSKSVDPTSGTVVEAGQTLDYTITLESTGQADASVSWFDDLTGVVDDAAITEQPSSDIDTVTVSEVEDGRFRIGGTLAGGETATVTYQVTVKADGDGGDDLLANFVVAPNPDDPTVPSAPPSECSPSSQLCTENPVTTPEEPTSPPSTPPTQVTPPVTPPVADGLPPTGSFVLGGLGAAALLLALGVVAVAWESRRRSG